MTFGVNYGFAQISQFNNLCTNNTDLTFTSDFNTKEFKTSSSSCQKEDSDYLKNINYYPLCILYWRNKVVHLIENQ